MKINEQCTFLAVLVCHLVLLAGAMPEPCQQKHCIVNPCSFAVCPTFADGALCSPDYCNGCNAKWMMNGLDVTENCVTGSQTEGASSPVETAATMQKPAAPMQKPASPVQLPAAPVMMIEKAVLPAGATPEPCQQKHCIVNPCSFAVCPTFADGALCSPDYCNGCNAKWMMNGIDVTENCQTEGASSPVETTAPVQKSATPVQLPAAPVMKIEKAASANTSPVSNEPCQRRFNCYMDPCSVSACPAYGSEAVCSKNDCNGCSAVWTMDGVDVTETCIKSVIASNFGPRSRSQSQTRGFNPALLQKNETRGQKDNLSRADILNRLMAMLMTGRFSSNSRNAFQGFMG